MFSNHSKDRGSDMQITTYGVDLAKRVFQLHWVEAQTGEVKRKTLMRSEVSEFFAQREPGIVAMEACGSAHHWARMLKRLGHQVLLVSAQFVRPFVKTNKTDAADAQAIWEAAQRPQMRFVAVKTVAQQDVQAVHRVRAEVSKQRKAKGNQIRGLVSEYGLVAPKELVHLRAAIPTWLEDAENGLTGRFRRLLNALWHDLRALDQRMLELDREIALIAAADPVVKRLQQLRGVGPVIATALVATVGDVKQFANGRQLAASLGLTPRQNSSGGKERLLGISKRGDAYLRTLLVHGARSALRTAKNKEDRLSRWVSRIAATRHYNVAAVALANKTTRIAWAMMKNGTEYEPDRAAA